MKTELTKEIEKALMRYNPSELGGFEINYRRKQYLEYEVPVIHSHIEGGLVDAVWLSEGFRNPSTCEICGAVRHLSHFEHCVRKTACALTEDELRSVGVDTFFPCTYDGHCFWKRMHRQKEEAIAVMCFEIKISKSDFKSPNGHNFVGNLNCYVMPYALFKQVKDDIPEGIGVITYHKTENSIGSLRRQVSPVWVDLPDDKLYLSMLHTILNKKDKMINKINSAHRKKIDTVISSARTCIKAVVTSARAKINKPDCYENCFGNCLNSYSCADSRSCIFSSRYVNTYEEQLDKGVYDE